MQPSWWAERAVIGTPGVLQPGFLRLYRAVLEPLLSRMHRPSLRGAEHVPRDRPFLLVANHSGGMALSELLCLLGLYQRQLADVRIAGLAHPFGFHFPPINFVLRALGAVPSTYAHARRALDAGLGVLVFPGGDHEVSRPFWQAHVVDFNRRQGFLRIAREAGVPIVPMGISGSHNSVPILWRSTWLLPRLMVLPWLFGIKRFPMSATGLVGLAGIAATVPERWGWAATAGASWLWIASLIPFWPVVPTTIRYRIGRPMELSEVFADDDLDAAHERVRARVQALVDDPLGDEAAPAGAREDP